MSAGCFSSRPSQPSYPSSQLTDAQTAGEMGVNLLNAVGFALAGGNGAASLARTLQGIRQNVLDAALVVRRAAREA